jgi:hypothetical protein
MKKQEHLLKEVRGLFKQRLILEVENKSDAKVTKSKRMRMSALTGAGVADLVAHIGAVPPAKGAKPAWAAEEE